MSDIKTRTMEEAFYLQTKAFLEKNSEHIAEIARLKAEVERLTELNSSLDIRYDAACGSINGSTNYIGQLEEDIERLTKAGDAMEVLIVEELAFYEDDGSQYDEVKAWNAAKGGKRDALNPGSDPNTPPTAV